MQRIRITRDEGNNVLFETVSVDRSENVFYINLDPLEPHWPDLASNQVGPAPSAPSSQCQPDPLGDKNVVFYHCQIPGHEVEQGVIKIFEPLVEANQTLKPAIIGQPISDQQVVQGGMSPYQVTDEVFEVVGPGGVVIKDGAGVGPGLQLIPTKDDTGVFVGGVPALSGTYNFTFTVVDAMGGNLQQVQYTMKVT